MALQKDMKIVGVVKTRPTFEAHIAQEMFPLFANTKENLKGFQEAGVKAEGTLDELIDDCDLVVDCTPKPIGSVNKEKFYVPRKKKAIFQGGEKADLVESSFSTMANYENCLGKDYVRVVSCNTTAMCRVLSQLERGFGIERVRAVLVRRGPDPMNDKKGPVNSIIPDPAEIPSHHGPDVLTCMPGLDIITSALKVPTTLMHVHSLNIGLRKASSSEDVADLLKKSPRIMMHSVKSGIRSTSSVMEFARDIGRKRADHQENAVWEESVNIVNGKELFLSQAVHQESIVTPENVDCIRSMFELTEDRLESMRKTDESMGLKKWW